ncbi:hypothetical protein GJ496_003523 [Pomphorhynchus laevis]|nr:hypothetical protein GJ496_003523 [Pomphorhynchus laevis]
MGCTKSKVLDSEAGIRQRTFSTSNDLRIIQEENVSYKEIKLPNSAPITSTLLVKTDDDLICRDAVENPDGDQCCADTKGVESDNYAKRNRNTMVEFEEEKCKENLRGLTFTDANRLARTMFFDDLYLQYIPEIRADTNGMFKVNKIIYKSCTEIPNIPKQNENNESSIQIKDSLYSTKLTPYKQKNTRRASFQNGYIDKYIDELAWKTSYDILMEHKLKHITTARTPKNSREFVN